MRFWATKLANQSAQLWRGSTVQSRLLCYSTHRCKLTCTKRHGQDETPAGPLFACAIDANLSFVQFCCRKFPTLHLHPDDFPPPRVAALGGVWGVGASCAGGRRKLGGFAKRRRRWSCGSLVEAAQKVEVAVFFEEQKRSSQPDRGCGSVG